jgi:2-polyprenyl-3-methyl-5-hydroxy-6-metoxy-1,4-benzoquinol methylase
MKETLRKESFGESYRLTCVDRFGIWLSARQIKRWVGDFRNKRVADVGCGFHAPFSRTAASEALSLLLVDLSLSPELASLQNTRSLEGYLPKVLVEVPNDSLDVVVCNSVIEHVWEAQGTLTELFRICCPGGYCLINVPSWRGKFFLEFAAFRLGISPKSEIDDHKRYYDPHDLWPMLVKAGFKPSLIKCFTHKFGLNTFAVCKKS